MTIDKNASSSGDAAGQGSPPPRVPEWVAFAATLLVGAVWRLTGDLETGLAVAGFALSMLRLADD